VCSGTSLYGGRGHKNRTVGHEGPSIMNECPRLCKRKNRPAQRTSSWSSGSPISKCSLYRTASAEAPPRNGKGRVDMANHSKYDHRKGHVKVVIKKLSQDLEKDKRATALASLVHLEIKIYLDEWKEQMDAAITDANLPEEEKAVFTFLSRWLATCCGPQLASFQQEVPSYLRSRLLPQQRGVRWSLGSQQRPQLRPQQLDNA
jgi:hypothetical protein